jgi:hypothetical protein
MRTLSSLAAVAIASAAYGQTITAGDSTFTQSAANTIGAAIRTGATGGTAAVMTPGGSVDQLFQQWWWYRVNGVNAREFAFSNRTSNNASGNELILTYAEPEGFEASIRYVLTDGPNSPASCLIANDVTLRTTSTTPISLAIFSYLDYDLQGAGSDSAALVSPGLMRVTDTTGFFGEFLGVGAAAYNVATFPNTRNLLTDADIDNFANSGLPFAAADWSGAFQWNVTISLNNPVTIRTAFTLNLPADPCAGLPAGDVDGDHDVDLTDLATLLTNFGVGSGATRAMGDLDGDMDVDLTDLSTLLTTFGSTCP